MVPEQVWFTASLAVIAAIFGGVILVSALASTAGGTEAIAPTAGIAPSQVWNAVKLTRQGAQAPRTATDTLGSGQVALHSLAPFELAPITQASFNTATESLLPDVDSLYAGAEGPADGVTADGNDVRVLTVEAGDTLATLLADAGAKQNDVANAVEAISTIFNPKQMKQGQRVTVTLRAYTPPPVVESTEGETDEEAPVEPERDLISVLVKPTPERDITVRRTSDGKFSAAETTRNLRAEPKVVRGIVDSSLYLAATAAGVPENVTTELIRIFSYDVDFQREVQQGDAFEILFIRFFDEFGEPVKEGEILFGELKLSGKATSLYQFKTEDDQSTDYYGATGTSAKRFLYRTPIDGARISSGFGKRRHPILGYNKMHKGVDFAAPTGTPIMAAGNGEVELAGKNGSYGNYVRIRHSNGYKTAYAHLSRFGAGIKKGQDVRQGHIIGYVGTTGRSTGPHLHYEVLVNDAQVDPKTIKVATGRTLTGGELKRFEAERDRIDQLRTTTPSNEVPIVQTQSPTTSN
jgi:murein DD-endopeptidase MepM/ murein hydrolase activator NlpD